MSTYLNLKIGRILTFFYIFLPSERFLDHSERRRRELKIDYIMTAQGAKKFAQPDLKYINIIS